MSFFSTTYCRKIYLALKAMIKQPLADTTTIDNPGDHPAETTCEKMLIPIKTDHPNQESILGRTAFFDNLYKYISGEKVASRPEIMSTEFISLQFSIITTYLFQQDKDATHPVL